MTVYDSICEKQSNMNAVLKDKNGEILFQGTIGDLSVSNYAYMEIELPTIFDKELNAYLILIK